MIEFYLGERPILNNVPTWRCREAERPGLRARPSASSSSRKSTAPAATACSSARPPRASRSTRSGKCCCRARQLHRAADAGAVHLPDLRRIGRRAAPHRSAALRAFGQGRAARARRAHARGAEARGRWSSTRRRAAARRTPGSWRTDDAVAADHLFWMARYMERAENTARMLDVNYQTRCCRRARRWPRRAGAGCCRSAS